MQYANEVVRVLFCLEYFVGCLIGCMIGRLIAGFLFSPSERRLGTMSYRESLHTLVVYLNNELPGVSFYSQGYRNRACSAALNATP